MEKKNLIKLYLDEDIRPLLAYILRERGYDAISAAEEKQLGKSDEEQLRFAVIRKRVLLTHNVKDFVKLHNKYFDKHYGIIVSDQVEFKILLQRICRLFSRTAIHDIKGKLVWLSNYKDNHH